MAALTPMPFVGSVVFDASERYRYLLTREIGVSPRRLLFLMLNPSKATAEENDPTIRRVMGYAKLWGFGTVDVCNIFAFRGTDPKSLYSEADPVGLLNDDHIMIAAQRASVVVCGWGRHGGTVKSKHGDFRSRGHEVHSILTTTMFVQPQVFGLTANLQPLHPLYLANEMPLIPWDANARQKTIDWFAERKR